MKLSRALGWAEATKTVRQQAVGVGVWGGEVHGPSGNEKSGIGQGSRLIIVVRSGVRAQKKKLKWRNMYLVSGIEQPERLRRLAAEAVEF